MTRGKKRADLFLLTAGFAIVLLVNVFSRYAFTRFDLTEEKRYTLAPTTVDMLKNLDDIVYFKVYLDGDFPQGSGDFERLRDETRIMLNEFRSFAGDKIQYEFIDPSDSPDDKERDDFYKQLMDKGLIPQQVQFTDDNGGTTMQKIFPWAVARYHDREVNVPLIPASTPALGDETALNSAVEALEYELTNAIRKLQIVFKPKIAITQGHGEPDTLQLSDFVKSLREYYVVDYVNFNGNLNAFRDTAQNAQQIYNKYSAVIVPGPDSVFTPQDLFILDQFIMYGGKALFLVDPVYTNMDSLAMNGVTYGLARPLGLEELLFRYGARLNTTIIEDLYCSTVEIPVRGQQMQFYSAPWYFSPTILPLEKNPIVRNLDRIKFDFLSSVDTVDTPTPVKKTILLKSSDKSRFTRAPVMMSLRDAMRQRDPRSFNKPNQPVAVLLEGSFESYYKNKFLPDTIVKSKLIGYKTNSPATKIIVVGDGDVIKNPVYKGRPLPLGLDRINRMNREFYANKTFLLNCMNYLCDDKGLISLRSREVTLRLLDRGKIKDHRLKWQMINTILPDIVVVCLGFVLVGIRRMKYSRANSVNLS